jgi:hypothetical protein
MTLFSGKIWLLPVSALSQSRTGERSTLSRLQTTRPTSPAQPRPPHAAAAEAQATTKQAGRRRPPGRFARQLARGPSLPERRSRRPASQQVSSSWKCSLVPGRRGGMPAARPPSDGQAAGFSGERLAISCGAVGGASVHAAFCRRRTSGGTASSASILSAASSGITCWPSLPSRRIDTVRSAASLRPTTRITGTLASECSRTL